MKPIDMIWAATKAHTLWPDADLKATTMGNLAVVNDDDYVVGMIDFFTGVVEDAETGKRYHRADST